MAFWIDRRKAAAARNKPSVTGKHDIKLAEIGYRNTQEGNESELDLIPDLVGVPLTDSVSKDEKKVKPEGEKGKINDEKEE